MYKFILVGSLLFTMITLEVIAEAGNGREAIEKIESLKPDLIFLDINLPGKSGIEFARSINPETAVIFTTAYTEYAVEGFENEVVVGGKNTLSSINNGIIIIELLENGKGSLNEGTGILKWDLTLKAKESKTLRFGYSVKSDKQKNLLLSAY